MTMCADDRVNVASKAMTDCKVIMVAVVVPGDGRRLFSTAMEYPQRWLLTVLAELKR